MRFNVSGLLLEAIGATRNHEVDFVLETQGHPSERVRGQVEFLRTRAGVLVRADLGLVEPETCSRCLKALDEQVDIKFEEEFQILFDPRTGQPMPSDERDPDAFLIDERHILDLSEAVRQYREVCLLIAPVCRSDCRGLCPRCGADLNEGQCACEAATVDSRWAELARLKSSGLIGKD
ncbi:MAG TPA: DUF177 domain-containing protein [Dehalococcoidia bacterium]|nr:DUF177 domain-containing protein [Dehalococcoidia bacterium]